jgi:hypothetical protein
MPDNPSKVAVFGKRADMQLIHDDFFPSATAPAEVAPDILGRIDDLARTVNAGGLATRRRVGNGLSPDDITVARPGPRSSNRQREPAILVTDHWDGTSDHILDLQ